MTLVFAMFDGDYLVALGILIVLLLLASCSTVHQSKPISGGSVQVMADGTVIVTQADNAKTPTPVAIAKADGTTVNTTLGTSSEPIITLKSGAPWTELMVTAAGILCLIGGVILAVKGWPRIGAALGLLLVGIGLMAGQYAWLIALGTAALFTLVISGLYYGYRTAEKQTATTAAPAAA